MSKCPYYERAYLSSVYLTVANKRTKDTFNFFLEERERVEHNRLLL